MRRPAFLGNRDGSEWAVECLIRVRRVEVALNVVMRLPLPPIDFVSGVVRFGWRSLPKLASIAATVLTVQQLR